MGNRQQATGNRQFKPFLKLTVLRQVFAILILMPGFSYATSLTIPAKWQSINANFFSSAIEACNDLPDYSQTRLSYSIDSIFISRVFSVSSANCGFNYSYFPSNCSGICSGTHNDAWGVAMGCPPGFAPDPPDNTTCTCIVSPTNKYCGRIPQYTLTLTSDRISNTIEPGQSYELTATVTDQDNNPPSEQVMVSVKVEVEENSGGHDHDVARPKGEVSPANGSSKFQIKFTSTQVSGIHTITATCDQCVNKTAVAKVKVMVDGLWPIPGSVYYSLTEDGSTDVIGATAKHAGNHYLTTGAALNLWQIATNFFDFQIRAGVVSPTLLHLNDASLKWGGKFDISGEWTGNHYEHDKGTVVDVRANWNGAGAISIDQFEDFKKIIKGKKAGFLFECTQDKKATPKNKRHNRTEPDCVSKRDNSQDDNRHFHLRLNGATQ